MRLVRLLAIHSAHETVLAAHGFVTETWCEAGRGLLWHKPLGAQEGLVIPTRNVHMVGMRYALDLLYLDKRHQIIRIVRALGPNRVGPFVLRGCWVVELPVGAVDRVGLDLGHQVTWQERAEGPAFS